MPLTADVMALEISEMACAPFWIMESRRVAGEAVAVVSAEAACVSARGCAAPSSADPARPVN